MKPRPKPLLGLVLGVLIGAVIVGLLWQLGVAPPDRLVLFGVLAVAIALTELLLTQTTRRGKRRFVTVMVIAGIFAGVALTGIPETLLNKGSISDGCSLTMTSATDEASPTDTSAFDPFDTTPGDTVSFTSATDEVLTNWDSGLGISIGGIPITLWTAQRANEQGFTEWSGSESVQKYLDELEDQSGLQLRGTYHVVGYIHADEGDCEMAGYLRINAEGPFATPLIIALWVAGALLLIIIVWVGVSVGRSVRDAKAFTEKPDAVQTPRERPVEPASPKLTPTPVAPVQRPPAEHADAVVDDTRVMPVAETQAMPIAETEAVPVTEADDVPDSQTEVLPTTEGEPASGSDDAGSDDEETARDET